MPEVLFWPAVGGGTEQYRCRTPGGALERRGWTVRYMQGESTDLRADVVVMQRVVQPGTPDIIRGLQAHGIRVVYDIDDWYDAVPAYNPASRTIDAETLATLHEALTVADLVTCSTAELAEGYQRFGATLVLPNYLDPDVWTGNDHYRPPHAHVYVGWMGHAAYRSADLDLLRPWLCGWLRDHPEVRFVVAGSDRSVLDGLGVGGYVCPPAKTHLRPYEHLPAMLAWFDIGLVPLTRNRFNQAKSWCKGMEYNAMGVPFVASAAREYLAFTRPGVNGELVRKGDWLTPLETILADLPAYKAGARRVAEAHMIDDHIDRWIAAYAPSLVGA